MTRDDAIRIIETTFQDAYVYKYYDSVTHQALNMAIEALSAEAVQGWIPCSERLPNKSGWYVVTVCGHERIVDVLPYNSGWNGVTTKQEVVAWMPLPEPYKQKTERRG